MSDEKSKYEWDAKANYTSPKSDFVYDKDGTGLFLDLFECKDLSDVVSTIGKYSINTLDPVISYVPSYILISLANIMVRAKFEGKFDKEELMKIKKEYDEYKKKHNANGDQ